MKRITLIALCVLYASGAIHADDSYKSQISYEEIIVKLNDANTARKDNIRTKEIIKEYTYNVGDDDSRNDARNKALNQVKVLILEETGVFVESYLKIDSITDKTSRQYVREEIKSLTAGIIKTRILDEKYDGKTFYIKASVLVDPDSVSEGISEVLKIRANQEEISKLQILLNSKEDELDMRSKETLELQKKLSGQELVNIAKEKELSDLKKQITALNLKLNQYQAEESKLQGELKTAQAKINQAVDRMNKQAEKALMIKVGMSMKEVVNAIGEPAGASTDYKYGHDCNKSPYRGIYDTSCRDWFYGKVRINFNGAGLVSGIYK